MTAVGGPTLRPKMHPWVPVLEVPAALFLVREVAAGRLTVGEAEELAARWATRARPVVDPQPPAPGELQGQLAGVCPDGQVLV